MEKKKSFFSTPFLAGVASVSSRGSSRKLGQEQKKMNDGEGGGERAITRLETLATQDTPFCSLFS